MSTAKNNKEGRFLESRDTVGGNTDGSGPGGSRMDLEVSEEEGTTGDTREV